MRDIRMKMRDNKLLSNKITKILDKITLLWINRNKKLNHNIINKRKTNNLRLTNYKTITTHNRLYQRIYN